MELSRSAAITAIVVHFGLCYTGQHTFPYCTGVTVKNPGISTALGIVTATLVGGTCYLLFRDRDTSPATR